MELRVPILRYRRRGITIGRKFLITNSLIIGTVIIIVGLSWMITDDFLAPSMEVVMTSFFVTISGLLFWWLGYHYTDQGDTKVNPIVNPLDLLKHHTRPKQTS